MGEIYPTQVVVALLPHPHIPDHIWVAQRTASREWQLPGNKVPYDKTPEEVLRAGLETKFGISPRTLMHLGRLPLIPYAEGAYVTDCFLARDFAFDPILLDGVTYTDARHVYPYGRNINHLLLSPITRYVFSALDRGRRNEANGMVLPGDNPIQ